MKSKKIQELQKQINDSNFDPKEVVQILSKKKFILGMSRSEILLRCIIPFISIIIYFLSEDETLGIMIIIPLMTISSLETILKVNSNRKLRKKSIQYWINHADHSKMDRMVSLLKGVGMNLEISSIAEYFLKAEKPEQMQSFPAFWDKIDGDLIVKYYRKFFSKINLIPQDYQIRFQTSIVQFPTIYAYNSGKDTLFNSPLVERCIFADYYLKYYFPKENETNKDQLTHFCDELELIVSLIDSEKEIFFKLWDDDHLDKDFRQILSELNSIIEKHPSYTEEYPTIYHLLIKNATNSYLKYITLKEAIQNVSRHKIPLNLIPETFNKVTKLCTGFSENQIKDLLPWEKLPIYWLSFMKARQKYEFPQISRLYCKNCLQFAKLHEIIGFRGKIYNLYPSCDCSFCPECRETKNLEYVPGKVIGVISDKIFITKENNDLHIGVWDHAAKKTISLVYEKLIFVTGLNIDYDWALIAILEQIAGGDENSNNQSIIVEMHSDIKLKENTERILNDFRDEGRIRMNLANTSF